MPPFDTDEPRLFAGVLFLGRFSQKAHKSGQVKIWWFLDFNRLLGAYMQALIQRPCMFLAPTSMEFLRIANIC